MLKTFLLILFLNITIFAKNSIKDENIQILAQNLEVKEGIVTASGEVVVYSLNYYITANRLIYDKVNAKLELFDDVNIVKNNEIVSYSQYIFIDINKDINNFKPMLVLDNTNKLWFNAENGLKKNDNFDLKNSTLSSCDCKDPSWSIGFSSGDFNTTKQWINTYNTTLYIKNIPVFYTPYFGFPTDDTRRTGFLTPTMGYSRNEGFLYAQPIYFAPKLNFDFEYIPQFRAKRGHGHALKYRYIDSLYSTLNFDTAIFYEKNSYQKKMKLSNDTHYGWNFEYKRSKLFSSNDHSDGLIVQSLDMNDVDYINSKYDTSTTNNTDKFLESQIKYFYNTNSFYGDISSSFNNDISKDNNDNVIQKIPAVTLHKYAAGIFNNILTTSLNISSSRKTRKIGVGGNMTEVYLPIGYHTYLFNDYLNFSFNEQINYTNVQYTNTTHDDLNFAENNHVFSLYTDLIKPYDSIIHSVSFNTMYTKSNTFVKSDDINYMDDIFPVTQSSNNISFGFNQSFYNKQSLKEIVNHKINQSYKYSTKKNSYEKDTLESDLTYNYNYGSLSNRLIYNYEKKILTSSSTTLKFKEDVFFANMYYTNLKDKNTLKEEKNFNYDLGLNFSKYYKISYKEEYDLLNNLSKKKEYVFNIDEKCWAIDFKLIDSLIASDTTTNIDSFRQKILYMEFNLKQLFQLEQKYEFKERG